jgi:hypothetical protein
LLVPACGTSSTETDEVAAAIEQDNGGLTLTNEAAAFGEPELFAQIETQNPAPADLGASDVDLMQLSGADRDRCGFAFALGRWKDLSDHLGVYRGRVITAAGLFGHIKGVFGARRDGAKVFFGKIINREGRAVALVHGHFDDGHFLGRILARDGDHGIIAGRYEAAPNDPERGRFQALLHETSCDRQALIAAQE